MEVDRTKGASQLAGFGALRVDVAVVTHARMLTAGTASSRKEGAMDVQLRGT